MLLNHTNTRKKKDKKQECLHEFQKGCYSYKPPRIQPIFFMELGTNDVRSIAINLDLEVDPVQDHVTRYLN
jgi:hypothetical protein